MHYKDVIHVKEEEMAITPPPVVVDWLELPESLTSFVMSKLSSLADFARFGAVCVQWHSIFNDEKNTKSLLRRPQLPLLMIPTPRSPFLTKEKKKKKKKKNNNNKSTVSGNPISCSFYRVTDGKIFKGLRLAMPRDRYVRGSGYGWLITVDQNKMGYSVQLINPFFYPNTATKEIKLPPLTAHPANKLEPVFHYMHLRKAVLSADPENFIVMAIFGGCTKLAFCKSGDKAWTPIRDNMRGCFDNVICYKGKFYAVHYTGAIVVCNLVNCTTVTCARPPVTTFVSVKKYIVVSSGAFLQVHRNVDYEKGGITVGFKIFKWRKVGPNVDWVEVKDLYGHALFLGDNASVSISSSDFPGCKPNSIYYTDDNIERYWCDDLGNGPHDLGVFNLENGSFEKHYPTDVNVQMWPAPVWIEPTLQRSTTRTFSECDII